MDWEGGRLFSRTLLLFICLCVLTSAAAQQTGDQERKREPSGLYQVYRDEKSGHRSYGFINKTGKLVIGFDRLPRTTDRVGDFSEGLAAIYVKKEKGDPADGPDTKAGYIDATGNIVIALRWDYAGDFSDGMAVVLSKRFQGYINRRGEEVIKLDNFRLKDFHEGLAAVGWNPLQANSGYIDHSGKLVIERKYTFVDEFSEGLAGVVVYGKYGFINQKGGMVIAPRFEPRKEGDAMITAGTSRFSEGLACVRVANSYGYIDKKGNFVIPLQFAYAQEFSEGLAWVVTPDGKIGWIDKSARYVITVDHTRTLPTSHALVATTQALDWRFSEGLVPYPGYAEGKYRWGYMDQRGKVIIQPREFDSIGRFLGGLARVEFYEKSQYAKGKFGYIDRKTKQFMENKYGYIDKTGRFIWRAN